MGVAFSYGCVEACGDKDEHARRHAMAPCAATCEGNGRTCAKDAVVKATLLTQQKVFLHAHVRAHAHVQHELRNLQGANTQLATRSMRKAQRATRAA
jgi:hypothetical protein